MSEIMDNPINEAFQTELAADDLLKRCAICGFIVDTKYAAEKPTIDFSMAGRSKRSDEVRAPPMNAPAQGQAELLHRNQIATIKWGRFNGEIERRLQATALDALDRLAEAERKLAEVEQERDHWFDDAIADRRQRKRAEAQIVRLREALEQIGRMKLFPDDKVNRMTLLAALESARAALAHPSKPGDTP